MKGKIQTLMTPNTLYDVYRLNFKYINNNGLVKAVLQKRKQTEHQIKINAQTHSIRLEHPLDTKDNNLEMKRLKQAYHQGCNDYKGKLSIDFLVKLNEILEPCEIYSTQADPKPHRIRADGDRVVFNLGLSEAQYKPPYYNVREELDDFMTFINNDSFFLESQHFLKSRYSDTGKLRKEIINHTKLTTIERAALAHFHIVTIHPFFDGNGRVARTTQDIMLYKNLLLPAIIRDSEKGFYMDLLQHAQIKYKERTKNENYWEQLNKTTNKIEKESLQLHHYTNLSNTEKYFFNYLGSKVLSSLMQVLEQ